MIRRRRIRTHSVYGNRIKPAGIQCSHCGGNIPLTDVNYTENSGMCIPCWEAEVL